MVLFRLLLGRHLLLTIFFLEEIISISLLHLHEIVEELYFHCSLSVCLPVCLCVCVCVCPAMHVNKIQAERMNRFGRGLLTTLTQSLLKLVTIGQRSRSQ